MQAARSRLQLADLAILDDLPSPPAVALEILRLSRRADTGIDELAGVLAHDPAMASKVMRVANSAVYRRRGDATSVADAATRIGLRSLVVIALGFSLVRDLPRSGELAGMSVDRYWRRSLTVAVVARRIAARCLPQLTQEAFALGLFAHMGRLVLAEHASSYYRPLVAQYGGWPDTRAERVGLGFSSLEIGAALVEAWDLPSVMVDTLAALEGAPPLEGTPELVDVLTAAIAADAVLADPADSAALAVLDHFAAVADGVQSAEELLEGAAADLAEALETFGFATVGDVDIDALLGESRRRLVKASLELAGDLETEHQRARSLDREVLELQRRVREDALTHLPNRAALEEFLRRELELRRRADRADAIGVLLIDVDRFKLLNDEHGHPVGDDVLRLVAATLSSGCRHGELLARYGGEEFLLVAPSCDVEDLFAVGERLRGDVEQLSIQVGEQLVSVTVSVGGACARDAESMEDAERLIQKADGYLYRAKRRGRNRTEVSPEDLL